MHLTFVNCFQLVLSDNIAVSVFIDFIMMTQTERYRAFLALQLVTRFNEPIDLFTSQAIAQGSFVHENYYEPEHVLMQIPSSTKFVFGLTAPSIVSLCQQEEPWCQKIMNSCAALIHKEVQSMGSTEIDVIPFIVQDLDYEGVNKYRLHNVIKESAKKVLMVIFVILDDEVNHEVGHYAFVEIDKVKSR